MWNVQSVTEHEPQRVLTWWKLELGLGLTGAEMAHLIGRRQREVFRWQWIDVDQQMVVPGIRRRDSGRRYAHAAQAEPNGDRRPDFGPVNGRLNIDLGSSRCLGSRQGIGSILGPRRQRREA